MRSRPTGPLCARPWHGGVRSLAEAAAAGADGPQLANDRANADNARPLMPDDRIRAPGSLPRSPPDRCSWPPVAAPRTKADPARGKELFTQRCGACHILENAGTKGVQGPNLDLAFKQSVADGLGRSTIEGVVRSRSTCRWAGRCRRTWSRARTPTRSAAYVASAIGKKGSRRRPAGPSGTAKADAQNTWQIPADPTGQLAYQFKNAEAKPGKVTIESQNDSSVPHNIALKGGPGGRDRPGRQDLHDHRQPEARQADLLLQRARPRAGRDEGHSDGQRSACTRPAARARGPGRRPRG